MGIMGDIRRMAALGALSDDPAERDRAGDRLMLLAAVQKAVFCQITGKVLDIDTAVYVTFVRNGATVHAMVFDGPAVDTTVSPIKDNRHPTTRERVQSVADAIEATVGEYVDGRELAQPRRR